MLSISSQDKKNFVSNSDPFEFREEITLEGSHTIKQVEYLHENTNRSTMNKLIPCLVTLEISRLLNFVSNSDPFEFREEITLEGSHTINQVEMKIQIDQL